MKKLVCLLWATLIAAAAAEIDVNGAFKTDDKGQSIDWKFTTDPKSPGKFEILKGNPNVLKLTGGEKAPVIMHGKKIAVKDGDKIRLSVEVGPGQYALTGIYLHGEKGYITSTYKVTQPPKGGVVVSAVLEAKDPSGKQCVTSVVPYLRVHNQLTAEFKNFRFELNPVIVIPPPPSERENRGPHLSGRLQRQPHRFRFLQCTVDASVSYLGRGTPIHRTGRGDDADFAGRLPHHTFLRVPQSARRQGDHLPGKRLDHSGGAPFPSTISL